MSRINSRTLVVVPYDQMVRNLFKDMGSPTANLLHAVVGLAGEVGELLIAASIDEIVLEMGDVEFYVEAAYQSTGGRNFPELILEGHDMSHHQVFSTVGLALSISAARLLGFAKRAWIYGEDPNLNAVRYELMRVELMLGTMRELVRVSKVDVLGANQAKLGKRFPEGVYTDRDAAVQADQPGKSEVD